MNCCYCGEKLNNHSEIQIVQACVVEIIVICENCSEPHGIYLDLEEQTIELDFSQKTFKWEEND